MERIDGSGYLDNLKVLLLTYEGQKPPAAAIHENLADWVRSGHILVLFGKGDEYNAVREWWNQDGASYASPQEHLTEMLGLGRHPSAGEHACGEGWAILDPSSPAELAHDPRGWKRVFASVKKACQLLSLSLPEIPVLVANNTYCY